MPWARGRRSLQRARSCEHGYLHAPTRVATVHSNPAFPFERESIMRVSFRRAAAMASLLLVGIVAISACSPGAPTPSNGTGHHGGAVTMVPSPKGPWIENFNPLTSGNNSLPGTQGMIYETLLYF